MLPLPVNTSGVEMFEAYGDFKNAQPEKLFLLVSWIPDTSTIAKIKRHSVILRGDYKKKLIVKHWN